MFCELFFYILSKMATIFSNACSFWVWTRLPCQSQGFTNWMNGHRDNYSVLAPAKIVHLNCILIAWEKYKTIDNPHSWIISSSNSDDIEYIKSSFTIERFMLSKYHRYRQATAQLRTSSLIRHTDKGRYVKPQPLWMNDYAHLTTVLWRRVIFRNCVPLTKHKPNYKPFRLRASPCAVM